MARPAAHPGEAAPALEPMLAWLASSRVVTPEGAVLSWSNPANPGYPYPEAAALWLSLACTEAAVDGAFTPAQVDAVAAALCRDVDRDGAASRFGRLYLFDSGIALAALVAYERRGGPVPVRASAERLVAFIRQGVASGRAVLPVSVDPPTHWSSAFGGHLVKVALALHRWADHAADPAAREDAAALVAAAARLWQTDRYVVTDGSDLTYLHATLYGYEGLAWLGACGLGDFASPVARGADRVSALQHPTGGIPPFWNGRTSWGDPRADVAAQAVRVWLLDDAARHAAPVARALAFLGGLQTREGGLRYEVGSDDVNTWSTLFAVQAALWATSGPTPGTLF